MVPGARGHGVQWNNIMPYLSHKYTVVAYDRRQMSSSTVSGPLRPLNPVQQARDVVAITKALGRKKSHIFANSGGGVLGFELASTYPEAVEHVICHETPTNALLPDAAELTDHYFKVLHVSQVRVQRRPGIYFELSLSDLTTPPLCHMQWRPKMKRILHVSSSTTCYR